LVTEQEEREEEKTRLARASANSPLAFYNDSRGPALKKKGKGKERATRGILSDARRAYGRQHGKEKGGIEGGRRNPGIPRLRTKRGRLGLAA